MALYGITKLTCHFLGSYFLTPDSNLGSCLLILDSQPILDSQNI